MPSGGHVGTYMTNEDRVCAYAETVSEDLTTSQNPQTYRHEHVGRNRCYGVLIISYLRDGRGLRVGVDMDRRRLLIVRHFSFDRKVISVPYDVTASVNNNDTYE
jgi:hypothetical protein